MNNEKRLQVIARIVTVVSLIAIAPISCLVIGIQVQRSIMWLIGSQIIITACLYFYIGVNLIENFRK